MKPLSEVAPGLLVIQIPIQAVWFVFKGQIDNKQDQSYFDSKLTTSSQSQEIFSSF